MQIGILYADNSRYRDVIVVVLLALAVVVVAVTVFLLLLLLSSGVLVVLYCLLSNMAGFSVCRRV